MLEGKDKDMESMDFSEEMDDDLRYTGGRSRRKTPSPLSGLPLKWVILGAAALLVFVVSITSLFGRSGRIGLDELNAVRSAVERVEQRVATMETISERVALVERQEVELRDSIRNMNQTLGSLSQRLAAVSEKVESAQKQASAPKSTAAPAPAQGAAVHEVRAGETLYAIAKQYNMTINDLVRMNKLGANMTIHPGQKLVVSR